MAKKQIVGVLMILAVVPLFAFLSNLSLNWQLRGVTEHLLYLEEQVKIVIEYKQEILDLEMRVLDLSIDLEACEGEKEKLLYM